MQNCNLITVKKDRRQEEFKYEKQGNDNKIKKKTFIPSHKQINMHIFVEYSKNFVSELLLSHLNKNTLESWISGSA